MAMKFELNWHSYFFPSSQRKLTTFSFARRNEFANIFVRVQPNKQSHNWTMNPYVLWHHCGSSSYAKFFKRVIKFSLVTCVTMCVLEEKWHRELNKNISSSRGSSYSGDAVEVAKTQETFVWKEKWNKLSRFGDERTKNDYYYDGKQSIEEKKVVQR